MRLAVDAIAVRAEDAPAAVADPRPAVHISAMCDITRAEWTTTSVPPEYFNNLLADNTSGLGGFQRAHYELCSSGLQYEVSKFAQVEGHSELTSARHFSGIISMPMHSRGAIVGGYAHVFDV